jgi:hypothetical protein
MITRMDNFLTQQEQAHKVEKDIGDLLEAVLVDQVGRENVHVVHDSIVVDLIVKDDKILFRRS